MEFKNPLKGKSTAVKVLVIFGIVLLLIAGAAAVGPYIISNTGHINSDAELSLNTNTFNWGNVNPSQSYTKEVTITNTGDNPTSSLTFAVSSTFPTESLGLTWNVPSGTVLAHDGEVTATFTLTVKPVAQQGLNFEFDINIYG